MKFPALQISEILHGTVEGDTDISVDRPSKIEEGGEGTISFLANPKYTHHIYDTTASIVIVANDFTPTDKISATLTRVENPYTAFTELLEFYDNFLKSQKVGIEQPSYIAEGAITGENMYLGAFAYIGAKCQIGNNVKIYPQAYIGDGAKIGDGTVIYAGVKIYQGVEVGKNCVLHSGVVLGADGFGFAPQMDGTYKKIPQTGNVVIEDNVEIGANTTIDRATMGSTMVKKGTKLDNLIQIAHNVTIGENTVIAAQTGVAGSTKIGEHCMIGGQVGFSGHIKIGANSQIGAQSGIMSDLKEGSGVIGSPAFDFKDFMKSYVIFRRLPQLSNKINEINKKLNEIEK
ncbi:MAG: UDP-3-O-(3-hydroxymyristoyl)glucosamine N-acyltransferase [Flavobacteriales bacterium]|nr:UDP-3-O-(3-hydroxymyristoyl)glucosamine N-acyltransferase [Flavobacteriales bacterium]